MLYDLVQTRRGKETVVMTGELPKVRDRARQLRQSQRKGVGAKNDRVAYTVREATPDAEKFKQRPHDPNLSGGSAKHPRVPRRRP